MNRKDHSISETLDLGLCSGNAMVLSLQSIGLYFKIGSGFYGHSIRFKVRKIHCLFCRRSGLLLVGSIVLLGRSLACAGIETGVTGIALGTALSLLCSLGHIL